MIGVFDSGIGGLTVVKEIRNMLPEYDVVYFGDTARVPYGNKSPELIKKYALEDARFLLDKGAKLIVIACNSASAVAREYLREQLDVPVLGVIGPAVHAAKAATINGRIGVIGTRATVNSGIYQLVLKNLEQTVPQSTGSSDRSVPAFMRKGKRIQTSTPVMSIVAQAAPLLVPLVEEGYIHKPETKQLVRRYLQPLKQQQIDTLILGCTHYPILKEVIRAKAPKIKLIDPAQTLAAELELFIKDRRELDRSLSKRHELRLYVSDLTLQVNEIANLWLGKHVNVEEVQW